MTPIKFNESNNTLIGVQDLEIYDLPVYKDGKEIISCWKLSLIERLLLILGFKVWLRVLSNDTHHPVSLEVGNIWQE